MDDFSFPGKPALRHTYCVGELGRYRILRVVVSLSEHGYLDRGSEADRERHLEQVVGLFHDLKVFLVTRVPPFQVRSLSLSP